MPGFLLAQETVLTLEAFLDQVRTHHPVSRRAELLQAEANAMRLQAAGAFDPMAYLDYDDKRFKTSDYWEYGEGGIKLPTMGGLEFSGGYRWASGSFLNPEQFQPVRGQAFMGVKANLLNGLVTDERRTGIRQADLRRDWNVQEARSMRNDLLYSALSAYIDWSYQQQVVEVLTSGVQLASDRLAQTVQGYEAGDLPALDTLETALVLQQRQADLLTEQAMLAGARQSVHQFLWVNTGTLADFPSDLVAESGLAVALLPGDASIGIGNNPDLRNYDFKLRDLEFERRLKAQKQLPKLSFKYELLADGFDFTPNNTPEGYSLGDFIMQDNKFTVTFSAPLLFRSARGELQLNAIKQQQTEWEQRQKQGELNLKLDQYLAQIGLLGNQLDLAREIVTNYGRLLEAERIKFSLGESSVFLLNSRENKLLEARMKLIKLEASLAKAEAGLRWVQGQL